ncbi:MAG: hypothetical protein ALECFALPRED_003197 [Alectoria fallacina]|uniref:lipoyl(octanoyl) transferase n=1 Tax=Alectoria fallacina TaxID=1903189 RepID=A0A8H3FIB4_9LECA|nr:MAG: hypothetical protein ALECFALPRED_003197 [Alectoria fallacina]
MRLRHLHLPGLTTYLRASAIQDHLVRLHLDHKASHLTAPAPSPVLLTFQTPPTYTCGRREVGALSPEQKAHLRADGKAEFHEALRGGQTTFHGPGQVTAYLILSLREHKLNARTHVRLLEDSVIGTCAGYWLEAHTTENPGVWIGSSPDERKLASVGVHLRRHVASHGVGLNVTVKLWWFDRIVACGLPEKKATSIEKEHQGMEPDNGASGKVLGPPTMPEKRWPVLQFYDIPRAMRQVADNLANQVALRLSGVDGGVENVTEKSIWPGELQSRLIEKMT